MWSPMAGILSTETSGMARSNAWRRPWARVRPQFARSTSTSARPRPLPWRTQGSRHEGQRPAGTAVEGLLERLHVDLRHLAAWPPSPDRRPRGPGSGASPAAVRGTTCQDQPEAVLEPATRTRLPAIRDERVPVAVDLGLVPARDPKRDRLVEAEVRPAVQRGERCARASFEDRRSAGHPLVATRGSQRGAILAHDPAVREQVRCTSSRRPPWPDRRTTGTG